MNPFVLAYLVQDGLAEGALYCLLALALVFVFSLTRIIFIPQGEFVSLGALTYIGLRDGRGVPVVGLVLVLAALAIASEGLRGLREGRLLGALGEGVKGALPALLAAAVAWGAGQVGLPAIVQAAVAVGLVTAAGPLLHTLVYKSISRAPVLVLLVVSVALHMILQELLLYVFGPGGGRADPLLPISFVLGGVPVQAQFLVIYLVAAILVALLWLGSERTLHGKALRAAALNPIGARLMGVSSDMAGRAAFLVAAFIGSVTGVLVSSVTTIYYDSGFLLGLKGFVASIIGGLASYPLSAIGALGLGLVESGSAFWASAFKETVVFSVIIPVLLWRSLSARHVGDDE